MTESLSVVSFDNIQWLEPDLDVVGLLFISFICSRIHTFGAFLTLIKLPKCVFQSTSLKQ